MRRDDREVADIETIYDILKRCDTIRVGMNDGDYPYIIPMTFGCEIKDGKIFIYFHSAGAGKKYDILMNDPRVCIEADLYYKVERTEDGEVTARYESVIGCGKAVHVTETKEKVEILKNMLGHYKESGFPVTSCKGLPAVEVFSVELESVTGKRNLGKKND